MAAMRSTHYHVGIVVPDLDAARTRLTAQVGVRWGPVLEFGRSEVRDGDGNDLETAIRFCYSADAPHLELIEELPGSIWVCNEHSNLHHIGFWSDDLAADSGRLAGLHCPMQLCGRSGNDGPTQFAYHRDELGIRIEVVDTALRSFMETTVFVPPDG